MTDLEYDDLTLDPVTIYFFLKNSIQNIIIKLKIRRVWYEISPDESVPLFKKNPLSSLNLDCT